jgi:RNA polymerase primary sigma factor
LEPTSPSAHVIIGSAPGDEDFDLSGWVAEVEEVSAPSGDASLVEVSRATQQRLSEHHPVDTDEDWSDVLLDLPELEFLLDHKRGSAPPLVARAAVRDFLSAALREGRVLGDDLRSLINVDLPEKREDELEPRLRLVLGDLGVTVDDDWVRHPEETSPVHDEDGELAAHGHSAETDEALTFFDALSSRSSDPLLAYSREVGAKRLLSREGEAALAKRIEAGRQMMIGGLWESPLTIKAISTWHNELKDGRKLLREVINLEATFGIEDLEGSQSEDDERDEDEDGESSPGMSVFALEGRLKPEALAVFDTFEKAYIEFQERSSRRPDSRASVGVISSSSEEYRRQHGELVALLKKLHLHTDRAEELVAQLEALNQRLTTLECRILRLAESHGIQREEFVKRWRGHELDPTWLDQVANLPSEEWRTFSVLSMEDVGTVRSHLSEIASETGMPLAEFRRVYAIVSLGQREMVQAKEELVGANLRLVMHLAWRHSNRGVDVLDLIQEGNIGLLKAADKFEYRRGYKFATYAIWWIRQAMTRAVDDQARTIRIPVHKLEVQRKLRRSQETFMKQQGKEPTTGELAVFVGMPEVRVINALSQVIETVSLDQPTACSEYHLPQELLVDGSDQVIGSIAQQELRAAAAQMLGDLDSRQAQIIRLRFGIGYDSDHTLEEIGQQYNVTRERIRQIESKALKRLGHPLRKRALSSFLN